jgi:hypothetical protein
MEHPKTKPASGLQEDWSWDVPDLTEGSVWFTERVTSLQRAIHGRDDAEELCEEGLKILARHR